MSALNIDKLEQQITDGRVAEDERFFRILLLKILIQICRILNDIYMGQ